MKAAPAGIDYEGWVGQLAVASRRQRAKRHLLAAGAPALPALRDGLLRHESPLVRRICAGILDHLLDDDAVPDLVAALDDPDPAVVGRALHALACDQCKDNECRPADDLFVPKGFELLSHPDPDVRAAAIDALGRVGRRDPAVRDALRAAADDEPNAGLRTMARRRAGLHS
jgi:HEAT repeat protein